MVRLVTKRGPARGRENGSAHGLAEVYGHNGLRGMGRGIWAEVSQYTSGSGVWAKVYGQGCMGRGSWAKVLTEV